LEAAAKLHASESLSCLPYIPDLKNHKDFVLLIGLSTTENHLLGTLLLDEQSMRKELEMKQKVLEKKLEEAEARIQEKDNQVHRCQFQTEEFCTTVVKELAFTSQCSKR
jgi:hypothetical protein